MFLAVRFERIAYECPIRISACVVLRINAECACGIQQGSLLGYFCVFLRIIAGYNLGLMEWERSPEVDKLKFEAAEHRYFAGAC